MEQKKSGVGDVPDDPEWLASELLAQRQYTLQLYSDLPASAWIPANFPQRANLNPPLWELGHLAYFAEFFCLRWRTDDPLGSRIPSLLDGADQLLNSSWVPHAARWMLAYPTRKKMFEYMAASLDRVLEALARCEAAADLSRFQLALLHEDMHAEALLMTRHSLGLALPSAWLHAQRFDDACVPSAPLQLVAGAIALGASARAYQFDNELPATRTDIGTFEIDASPVSAAAFERWRGGPAVSHASGIAMHVTHAEAQAYARDRGRRLPTEAEWEYAANASCEFVASTGRVWEWTDTVFAPREGFVPGPYRDYSFPWFAENGHVHMVLKGGSFATHPRLKYPQYRNFYVPDRSDVFCGFRTCAI